MLLSYIIIVCYYFCDCFDFKLEASRLNKFCIQSFQEIDGHVHVIVECILFPIYNSESK